MMTPDVAKRFIDKIEVTPTCWNWTAHKDNNGYAKQRVGGRNKMASHISWMLFRGHKPQELFVLHKCDNPACVNPAHLFLGTQKENVQDSMNKGRRALGEDHGMSILTAEQVKEIRATYVRGHRYKPSATDQTALANKFGVDQQVIWSVLQNRTWKE